ncbi:mitochondrial import inner membrane translocase subunit Tim9 B [Acyrthosiphon pisum]|uniref:Mitochondrial import inner membrane translocase subunit n=1 Tax=Acyrthosiphon pisum TaxID=7029 RepID=C4WTQ0_ACYPI|nr:mitochondrial import inner membrane translocase subunit Tim9 B [Acyrthosiphon pisum]BAH71270.1 ACYPI002704 [Acyrthosiphon pisum]|eukprot:NP_001156116.1 mitochondrial import inner membrane translocase subunit Tim9 B [Acyrthosiphon pisum]
MDEEVQLKNIKEFLQNYNKITDDCFSQCVYTLSQSRLTGEEALCASNCVQKSKFVDQKCMQAFIEHQQQSMQKFIEDSSQKQAEQEAAVVDSNISDTENKEIVQQESTE